MDQAIKSHLEGITFGEAQRHRNMAVWPIFSAVDGGPRYLTMKEAMAGGFLTVTEVSAGGAVPELKVVNSAPTPVLILDGEELAGAKQNRIVNTTILLRRQSETIIPVSCTEQGRWSYVSDRFDDSGHIAAHRVRGAAKQSVSASLEKSGRFQSDQGAVWDNVASVLEDSRVASCTGAMKDAFESKAGDINEYLGKFACLPGQKGLLVLIDGRAAGLDWVSLEGAYAALHPKLVKSYAMEAIALGGKNGKVTPDGVPQSFLAEALACTGQRFKSVGHGWDFRLEGKGMVGSALVYNKALVHAAFFRVTEAEKAGRMSGLSRRRGFRG
ncbi:MAG TPA: hypothetical protein PK545_07730 [Deltaproteobacteria bacterium]|nr:hypothetical protein [Deltaproteobacteria bacterium]